MNYDLFSYVFKMKWGVHVVCRINVCDEKRLAICLKKGIMQERRKINFAITGISR